jgi:hypothetical protein
MIAPLLGAFLVNARPLFRGILGPRHVFVGVCDTKVFSLFPPEPKEQGAGRLRYTGLSERTSFEIDSQPPCTKIKAESLDDHPSQ